jgi:hypothetical protein
VVFASAAAVLQVQVLADAVHKGSTLYVKTQQVHWQKVGGSMCPAMAAKLLPGRGGKLMAYALPAHLSRSILTNHKPSFLYFFARG